MNKVKQFVKTHKEKIVFAGVLLALSCAGGFLGAGLGVDASLAHSRFRIDLYASDGTHLGHVN